ncbi:MAG: isoprenylcysteine carboxylmethyltransferase family protein [Myxococcales bacterium]|nr:isoprenylcysteine carboxylmethyltransferase family protein [Myxococcales bacterium]
MLLRALLAFLLLPGLAAFVVPAALAYLDPWRSVFLPGAPVMALGLVLLVWCVRDFFVSGKGTLAPWDPPQKLVTVGLYRHVRNPMYVGVLTLVSGWAVLFVSPVLAGYVAALAAGFHHRVVRREEPWLASRFGGDWARYRARVRRWLPRLRPWTGAG